MSDPVDELARVIAGVFEQNHWVWGGHMPGVRSYQPIRWDIASKIEGMQHRPLEDARLVSDGRIVLAEDPEHPDQLRVLLDIGEIPLP